LPGPKASQRIPGAGDAFGTLEEGLGSQMPSSQNDTLGSGESILFMHVIEV